MEGSTGKILTANLQGEDVIVKQIPISNSETEKLNKIKVRETMDDLRFRR